MKVGTLYRIYLETSRPKPKELRRMILGIEEEIRKVEAEIARKERDEEGVMIAILSQPRDLVALAAAVASLLFWAKIEPELVNSALGGLIGAVVIVIAVFGLPIYDYYATRYQHLMAIVKLETEREELVDLKYEVNQTLATVTASSKSDA